MRLINRLKMKPIYKSDRIEKDPKTRSIFSAVDKEVKAELAKHPERDMLGFCHTIWETKKRILKEKHGIEWKSPSEMNPDICFD